MTRTNAYKIKAPVLEEAGGGRWKTKNVVSSQSMTADEVKCSFASKTVNTEKRKYQRFPNLKFGKLLLLMGNILEVAS